VELDHVLVAVADRTVAASVMESRYGLTSLEGGRHPGWGTASRIVPLGGAYLELVTAVDRAQAAKSVFGSWVALGSSECLDRSDARYARMISTPRRVGFVCLLPRAHA
jgi:hypothetical protein